MSNQPLPAEQRPGGFYDDHGNWWATDSYDPPGPHAPVRSDMSQWGPQEWADVGLYGTCQQCGWPRTVHVNDSVMSMVCGKDATHAA